jgi:hypothetical protein
VLVKLRGRTESDTALSAAASTARVVFTICFVAWLGDGPPEIYLAKHYKFVMVARYLQGLTAPNAFGVDEVDRSQPVVEWAAAALLLERTLQAKSSNSPPWLSH